MADINNESVTFAELKTYLFGTTTDFDSFQEMQEALDKPGSDLKQFLSEEKLAVYEDYKTAFNTSLKTKLDPIDEKIETLTKEKDTYYDVHKDYTAQSKVAGDFIKQFQSDLHKKGITFEFNGKDVTYTQAQLNAKVSEHSSIFSDSAEEQLYKSLKEKYDEAYDAEYERIKNDESSELYKNIAKKAEADAYTKVVPTTRVRDANSEIGNLNKERAGVAKSIEETGLNISGKTPAKTITAENKSEADTVPGNTDDVGTLNSELKDTYSAAKEAFAAYGTDPSEANKVAAEEAFVKLQGKFDALPMMIAPDLFTYTENFGTVQQTETIVTIDSLARELEAGRTALGLETETPEEPVKTVVVDPEVLKAQSYLTVLGFEAGPIDGIHGNKTQTALYQYANKNGIENYGSLSPADLNKAVLQHIKGQLADSSTDQRRDIASRVHTMLASNDPSQIKGAQTLLNEMGFKGENGQALVVDGIAGTQTGFATKALENTNSTSLTAAFQNAVGTQYTVKADIAAAPIKSIGLKNMFNDKAYAANGSDNKLNNIKEAGSELTEKPEIVLDEAEFKSGVVYAGINPVKN